MSGVAGEGKLELDGGQSAEAALASASVVGVLDPVDDRVVQVFAGAPLLGVQDVAQEQLRRCAARIWSSSACHPHALTRIPDAYS